MPVITVAGWTLLFLAALVTGVAKTGFPGVGILAVVLVAVAFPNNVLLSTGVMLPMLLLGDVLALIYYRRHAELKYLVKLVPCAVAGILIGYTILMFVARGHDREVNRDLAPIMGAVILVMLGLNVWRNYRSARSGEIKVPQGWWFPLIMGLLAGITTMMANAAGPIMVIYLLAMHLPKHAFLGTGAWYAFSLNAFKIPLSWSLGLITPGTLLLDAELAPVIIFGGLAGAWLLKYVPEKAFSRLMQFLAALAALKLLVSYWL